MLPRINWPEPIPARWTWFGVVRYPKGHEEAEIRQCYKATLLAIRLPIYGYHYQIAYDKDMWSRLVLMWHGWHGFRTYWEMDTLPKEVGIS